MRHRPALSGLAALLFIASPTALGGDLNPPAGPIAATGRFGPRIEINQANTPGDANSLFHISAPGSYYLGGNITGVAAKNGIEIASSGVTLDLMGFELIGIVGSLDGVSVSPLVPLATNVAVVNGSLRDWGGVGVNVSSADNTRLTDLRVSGNGTDGISAGNTAVITGCAAVSNGGNGINASSGATITACSALFNGGKGIEAFFGATITACSAWSNTDTGISGNIGSTISNCAARSNGSRGINTFAESTVTACAASSNASTGIFCTTATKITDCSAVSNDGDGMRVGNGSTVTNCTASLNSSNGIQMTSQCLVLANTCDANNVDGGGAAGIRSTSFDNRIEGNVVTRGTRGIRVTGTGNLIIRNSVSGATILNYSIVANNKVGFIVIAPGSLAISGSTGGAGVGTSNAWSNLSY